MTTAAERFAHGTAVVTGSGSGIGEGLARQLAGLGMTVIVVDVDRGRAQHVAGSINHGGGAALAISADVTEYQQVDALAQRVFDEHGGVDLLINNAGLQASGLSWEIDLSRWKQLMAVNVDGVFHGVRAFLPRMIARGVPAVVANLSSVGGVGIVPFQSPYIASKHAVQAFTECVRQEVDLLGLPIQVSAVLPHFVRSRIFQDNPASGHPQADAYFEWMQSVNSTTAMTPDEAAVHILEGLAEGRFWVFTDDEAGRRFTDQRSEQLGALALPPDPSERLRGIGVLS